MEHARPPAELCLDGGPATRAESWRRWYKQFTVFLKASGVHKEGSDVQASLLVNLIGAEGYDIYSTFKFEKDENSENLETVVKKFDHHFGTKQNTTMARFKFFTRNQEVNESIDDYVTALRILSHCCEFEHLEESLIRDRIVYGVIDARVRDRLLRSEDLTLDKAMKICQANEMSNEENRQIEVVKTGGGAESSSANIDAVYGAGTSVVRGRGGWRRARGRARAGGGGGRGGGARGMSGPRDGGGASAKCCAACGHSQCDGWSLCAAKYVQCYVCEKRGHYAKMCPVRNHKVYDLREEDSDNLFYVSTLEEQSHDGHSKWYESLYLACNGRKINLKLDTGSDLNVISMANYKGLGCKDKYVEMCTIKARSFCGNYIPIVGKCTINLTYKNKVYALPFVITKDECQSILGKFACEELGIIKRILSLTQDNYADLFQGLGKLPGKHKIVLESNASPTVCPVRKIPIGVRDKLKATLNQMVELGVIRKISHPTPWVNAIVLAAKKNGDIRVCLDPRPLNRAIRRAHYPLPTLTEIATKLQGACYFSKLDAKAGFWMVEIDDESADLCTFGTPFGRYQFLRLPYGINSASEVFHAKVRQLLEDLEGVDSFVDDIIVWGQTVEEHDARLRSLLDRAREIGIKFNSEKCQFRVEEVTYLGHTFSVKGMQIDKTKLRAIEEMPTPNDRSSLERFLGMVNYLSKFIPHYAETAAPLRGLLKKNVEWCWDSTHDAVVSQLKAALCSAPVLALYSSSEPVLLTVDASAHALGACLLQAGRPVEFASLTLTDTQRRYAQIEKEMLAIVFALERFHQYVFGRDDVTIETDHKPLEALFKKSLDAVPARLQRMMLRVQAYSFEALYKPGKYMFVADALSRAPLPQLMHEKVSVELEDQSCFLIENLRFSGDRLKDITEKVRQDEECKLLVKYIKNGWPDNKCDVDARVHQHWAHRETLEYVDGVILKDNLVYIPMSLRGEMIQRVHEGHQGIERCKRRARDVMFWCGMSRDVERAVRACRVCAQHAARPPREPMLPHQVPDLPWTKVGSDICQYGNKYYLILVDYFSNYIEVNQLLNIGTKAVVTALMEQFARHGIPNELITDNGPAYASNEFTKFCNEWGLRHITSSPNYPQSNGLSERAVRTVKNIIKKNGNSHSNVYLGLLNLRATPREGIGAPSQLLMGRRLQTRLPIHTNKLRPERNNSGDYNKILANRERSRLNYNTHSRPLPELHPGDEVIVADGAKRRSMQVQNKARQPRSYVLQDTVGRIFRRNRRHLIKIEEVQLEDKHKNMLEDDTASPSTSLVRKQSCDVESADDGDSLGDAFKDARSSSSESESSPIARAFPDAAPGAQGACTDSRGQEHTPKTRQAKRRARERIQGEGEEWGSESEAMSGEPRTPSSAGDRPPSSEASPLSGSPPSSPPRLRLNAKLATDPALAPQAAAIKHEAPSPSPPPPPPPPAPPTTRDYLALTASILPNLFPAANVPPYICKPCGIRYSSLSTLQAHQEHYCSNRIPKEPARDGSVDATGDESSGDSKTSRPPATGRQFACTLCSYSSDKKVSVNKHMRIHATSPGSTGTPAPTSQSNGEAAESPPQTDRYCADCDIRFSSIKTFRAHKAHYCNTRQVVKQVLQAARGNSATSGSAPPSPGATPPAQSQNQYALALPTNPILIVPYSILRSASTLPGTTLPDPDTPCFLLPNGTFQPISRALPPANSEGKEPEVLKSANRPREPPRDGTTPLDLSMRRTPESMTTDEHEKENRIRSATPEQIVCAPSLPGSPVTPSPSRRSSSPSGESSPKRRRRDSRGTTPKPPSISPPNEIYPQVSPQLLPPGLALRLASELPKSGAMPQVLVKQGVSKCKECNIVFCQYENYKIHKQHYCSAGGGEERVSPAPEAGPPPQYRQLICLACGIHFSSLDNLATHQSYYCTKRDTRSPRTVEIVRPASTNETGWKCPCCDVVSLTAQAAQRHMEAHGGVKAFRCTICRYRGNTLRGMRTHIRVHFPKKPADLQEETYISCVIEDESRESVSPSSAPATPGADKLHRCHSCAYTSTYRGNVVRHANLVHKTDEIEPEETTPPPPSAPTPTPDIKKEPDLETEETPNYCKSCDISFKYVNTYNAHKKFYCTANHQDASANNNVQPARVTDTPVL